MLKGGRVVLRAVEKADSKFFLKWLNDPEVIENLTSYLPISEIEEDRWIERLATERKEIDLFFTIEVKNDNAFFPIGNCSLNQVNQKNQNAEFGILIGNKDFWGKGLGLEAAQLLINYGFLELNLTRISSAAICYNERSIKMHKKIGFKTEGIKRKSIFRKGEFWDMIIFGILREEWI